METKKVLVPAIIAIVTLVVMTVGATYAYFTFGATDEFGTQSIEASTGAIGSGVSFKKVDSELSLNLSATDMLVENAKTYYASGSATPATIGQISVAGEGTFNCSYTMTITKSSTDSTKDMYERFQSATYTGKGAGEIFITLNEKTYDFNTGSLFSNNVITYNGNANGITSAAVTDITANLTIVNSSTVDQTQLNGTDITLTFDVTAFDCDLVETAQ